MNCLYTKFIQSHSEIWQSICSKLTMIFRNTVRDLKRPNHISEECWEASVQNWERIEANMEDFELPSGQERWTMLIGYALGFRAARAAKQMNRKPRFAALNISHTRLST
jgi:hypothetical protein